MRFSLATEARDVTLEAPAPRNQISSPFKLGRIPRHEDVVYRFSPADILNIFMAWRGMLVGASCISYRRMGDLNPKQPGF